MYTFSPVSPRIQKMRERYRSGEVRLDSEYAHLITDFYKEHLHDVPLLRRARGLYHVCANRTLRVEEDELIVGNLGLNYRGTTIWPEYGLGWLMDELDSGDFDRRGTQLEQMYLSEEDRAYYREIHEFWKEHSIGAILDRTYPQGFLEVLDAGVLPHRVKGNGDMPTAHFNANYKKVIDKGFGAIRAEAQAKLDAMYGKIFGQNAEKYIFYQAITIVCDAAIVTANRYAALCREKAETASEERRAELLEMAEILDYVPERPCRTFHDALMAAFMYQIVLSMDGNLHALTLGRFDQYTWPYLEADLAAGRITMEKAQELVDCLFLKLSELYKGRSQIVARGAGSYNVMQHMSLGGIDKNGKDATNPVSYMMLETAARLYLHSPSLSLRVNADTPDSLWEAAIECTKRVGGLPTFQNDDIVVEAMLNAGYSLEDARDYCIIGCVEPAGSGNDFSENGGPHAKTYLNLANAMNVAINNGINPLNGKTCGLPTGYLYEMTDFQQVKDAYQKQVEYFVDWHITMCNTLNVLTSQHMPLPILSATLDGCLESGIDCTAGGAKYSHCGSAAVGCANVANSLMAIKYAVFDKKLCTAREFYDAWIAGWEGYEPLCQRILNEAPKYGNGEPEVDELIGWAMDVYARRFNNGKSVFGRFKAGLYSVSGHIPMGLNTFATPDGRKTGTPLADGMSPTQSSDKRGPTAVLNSAAHIVQKNIGNGSLLNMKFHPNSVSGPEGLFKLRSLVQTYFDQGGMQVQYNVIGSDTLRAAQKNPEDYRDLVIRIAGFSAYFVELYTDLQNDLISRTDQQM